MEEAGTEEEKRAYTGTATYSMGDFVEAYWATRNIKKSTLKGYHNLKKHIERLGGRACDVKPEAIKVMISVQN